MKFILPLFLLSFALVNTSLLNVNNENISYEEKEDGTYKSVGVSDSSLNEYRIYGSFYQDDIKYSVSEISETTFENVINDCVIMVSRDIISIDENAFKNPHILSINFTGSLAEWSVYHIDNITVNEYQNDEGFINYWDDNIRPLTSSDICSLTKSNYLLLKQKYETLTAKDRLVVDEYHDKANQSIYDSMLYLSKYYADNSSEPSMNKFCRKCGKHAVHKVSR